METKQRRFGNIDFATDDNSIGQSQFDDTSTVETNLTRKDFVSEHWSGLDACLEGTDDFVFVVCDKNRDHWGDAKKLFKETSEDVYVNFRHAASCNEEARKQFEACLTDFFPSDERDPPATIKTSASQVTLQKHNKREGKPTPENPFRAKSCLYRSTSRKKRFDLQTIERTYEYTDEEETVAESQKAKLLRKERMQQMMQKTTTSTE